MNSPTSNSISKSILASIGRLSDDYARVIHEPNKVLESTEQELREAGGFILPFNKNNVLGGKTLVAIDGGRASQQLSGGDLMAVGATCGDGHFTVNRYGTNPIVETYVTIVPHASDNETSYGARVMSALELRVLEQADTDHIIIDGAYLGNTSEAIFGLINSKEELVNLLLEFNEDDRLNNAMLKILSPEVDKTDRIIAVPKSDSSYVQSKTVFGEDNPMSKRVSDRKLASHLLNPGEFMVPRPLETNPVLMKTLMNVYNNLPMNVRKIVQGKLNLLREMGGTWDKTYENHLYTAYFKPSKWTKIDRALKVEFVYYPNKKVNLLEHTAHIVEIINSDTVNNSLMEPYSQYIADVRAKEIGTGIDIAKQLLLNNVSSVEEGNSLTRNYRT
jgi:hypothetical protein